MEQNSIVLSLANLAGFPFVAEAMAAGKLRLCGLWHHIGSGVLHVYDGKTNRFAPLDV